MTPIFPWQKLFDVSVASATLNPLVPTVTAPSGEGVLSLTDKQPVSPDNLILAFYGTRSAADNETAVAAVTCWRRIGSKGALWVPLRVLNLNLQLGTMVGVAGQPISATEYFADTITENPELSPSSEVVSPADNTIGFVKIDTFGAEAVQVQLAKGTCASVNCLGSWYGMTE